jgi:outer membrane protein assembly factor BamB
MKRTCFQISLALAVLALTRLVAARPDAQGTLLWQHNLNGTKGNGQDIANSVAVDNQGNVVVAGSTENAGSKYDFTVAKFDRDGTLLWQQTLNGTASSYDVANSVAVDHQGNVVAAGFTSGDFAVVKFDGHGVVLWQQTLNGTANATGNHERSVR